MAKSKASKKSSSKTPQKDQAAEKAPATDQASANKSKSTRPGRRKSKAKATGVRYSDEQKTNIVNFVSDHDQKHGRGGQAAAVKKFGVSALSISKWRKGSGKPAKRKPGRKATAPAAAVGASTGSLAQKLQRMLAIEKQLEGLRAEFVAIKGSL
jgi:transposase-like protein